MPRNFIKCEVSDAEALWLRGSSEPGRAFVNAKASWLLVRGLPPLAVEAAATPSARVLVLFCVSASSMFIAYYDGEKKTITG